VACQAVVEPPAVGKFIISKLSFLTYKFKFLFSFNSNK